MIMAENLQVGVNPGREDQRSIARFEWRVGRLTLLFQRIDTSVVGKLSTTAEEKL